MYFFNNEKLIFFVLLFLLKVCFSFFMVVFIMVFVNVFGFFVFVFVYFLFFCCDFFGKGCFLRNWMIKNCFFNRIEEIVFEKCLFSSGVFSVLVDFMGNLVDVSILEFLLFVVILIFY